jgi:hypothetical protein
MDPAKNRLHRLSRSHPGCHGGAALGAAVIDGEAVAFVAQGCADFHALRSRENEGQHVCSFVRKDAHRRAGNVGGFAPDGRDNRFRRASSTQPTRRSSVALSQLRLPLARAVATATRLPGLKPLQRFGELKSRPTPPRR